MKYNDWKLLTESIGSGMNLGLKQPSVIGGMIGSHLNKDKDHDVDDEDHDVDDEDEDDVNKDNYDEDDEEDDEEKHKHKSGVKDNVDMSFLNDIDPKDVFPGDNEEDSVHGEDDEDSMVHPLEVHPSEDGEDDEDSMDGEDDEASMDVEASMDGKDDVDGEEKHRATVDLMKKMMSYCTKYMKSESVKQELNAEVEEDKTKSKTKGKTKGKVNKKIKKKEDTSKNCNCESDSFLNSLAKHTRISNKNQNSLAEDALFASLDATENSTDPTYEVGQVGFAPQGRIGSIGNGYNKNDFSYIPVLGEQHRLPTLKDWMSNR